MDTSVISLLFLVREHDEYFQRFLHAVLLLTIVLRKPAYARKLLRITREKLKVLNLVERLKSDNSSLFLFISCTLENLLKIYGKSLGLKIS